MNMEKEIFSYIDVIECLLGVLLPGLDHGRHMSSHMASAYYLR